MEKSHNILQEEFAISRDSVDGVLACNSANCDRTIVEYPEGQPSSKHSRGLPEEIVKVLRDNKVPTAAIACDHHGGKAYDPREPSPVRLIRLAAANVASLYDKLDQRTNKPPASQAASDSPDSLPET